MPAVSSNECEISFDHRKNGPGEKKCLIKDCFQKIPTTTNHPKYPQDSQEHGVSKKKPGRDLDVEHAVSHMIRDFDVK